MGSIEETKSKKTECLRNGEFNKPSLSNDFKNHRYDEIFAFIGRLQKYPNAIILSVLCATAQRAYLSPNANEFSIEQLKEKIEQSGSGPVNLETMNYQEIVDYANKRIVQMCEKILCKLMMVRAPKSDTVLEQEIKSVLAPLQKHPSEKVRLHYCANVDYEPFLNDENRRLRKVARILDDFYHRYYFFSENEVKCNNFLAAAIITGAITVFDGDVRCERPDMMYASFSSLLFEKGINVPEFDADICYTIDDKRILADVLMGYIKSGEIVMHSDILPPYFKTVLKMSEPDGRGPINMAPKN